MRTTMLFPLILPMPPLLQIWTKYKEESNTEKFWYWKKIGIFISGNNTCKNSNPNVEDVKFVISVAAAAEYDLC